VEIWIDSPQHMDETYNESSAKLFSTECGFVLMLPEKEFQNGFDARKPSNVLLQTQCFLQVSYNAKH